ncbi:MAG: hypothetical protein JKY96_04145, partial [Phycisphaerales bacterium]|nr:hypothetical protein [Phycisphaerales bacterium]
MRAELRLARSICSARPSRLLLLSAAVGLSVVLVTAIACAMASINAAFIAQLNTQVGTAEIRVQASSGKSMPIGVLDEVNKWEGVEHALPRLNGTLSLVIKLSTMKKIGPDELPGGYRAVDVRYATNSFVKGTDPALEIGSRTPRLIDGRHATGLGEIVIDARIAQRLSYVYASAASEGE